MAVVRALARVADRYTSSAAPELARHLESTVCELAALVHDVVDDDATPEGGVVRVVTRVTELGEHWWTVEDSGGGIPREVLASVITQRCSRRAGGTGLGLAIAAATIGRHGGVLEVQASPGTGTRMTARLPAAWVQ
jgi:nitrogen-specific signal transduction histidine kinase